MPSPPVVHQAALKRELGLTDLVLAQILFMVGLTNFGNSAKLGPSHVVFWLAAIVLFYIPHAMVVIHLNRWRPLEGGLYQWARAAFGDVAGFLVAWNLWIYAMFLMSEIGLTSVTNLAYAIGPSAAWIPENNWIVGASTAVLVIALAVVSILGLSVGKWVYNLGGVAVLVLLAALMAVQFLPHTRQTMSLAMPPLTLINLSILGKLAFYALGGFEYMAVFAGECKDPERLIGKSVMIAAPLIAALFIFGTSAVLSVVDPADVDLVSPVLQAISIAARPMKVVAHVASAFFSLLLISRLAQSSINFTVNSRLPMVAGWDHLLPEWFTRLHRTRRTPVNSTLVVAALILVFAFWGMSGGTGRQEAFQLLSSAMGIFYGLTYLVMFAIPILGHASTPMYMRLAAMSAFGMTLLCVVLALCPIVPVPSPWSFATKLGLVVLGANGLGALIYWVQTRGSRQSPSLAQPDGVV
jgi:amino acid transporter